MDCLQSGLDSAHLESRKEDYRSVIFEETVISLAEEVIQSAKVEEYHHSAKQDLGLGDYQGRELRGIIAHLVSVALAHILVVFMKACLPRLKGASTGQLVRDFICTPCRVNNSRAGPTVLFERALPYSKAIRHYRMARAG